MTVSETWTDAPCATATARAKLSGSFVRNQPTTRRPSRAGSLMMILRLL